jgi:antirestriction protein ArdC
MPSGSSSNASCANCGGSQTSDKTDSYPDACLGLHTVAPGNNGLSRPLPLAFVTKSQGFASCPFGDSLRFGSRLRVKEPNLTHEKDKNMKSEEIQKLTTEATDQLIAALNQGRSETLTQYLKAMARFHRYSLGNIMLIASQKRNATRVAGFRTWNKLGRFVRKGEKGIFVLAPIMRRKTEAPEKLELKESTIPTGFRPVYVFDISQTEGQELPSVSHVTGDPREFLERLAALIRGLAIVLEYSEDIAPALGTSSGGKITLLPGQSPASEFVTLSHELAHELMHRNERRGKISKCVRETEAEAVAYVVSQAIGLETISAARDYIQLYNGDANLLTESLEYVRRTANLLLEAIHMDQDPISFMDVCDGQV